MTAISPVLLSRRLPVLLSAHTAAATRRAWLPSASSENGGFRTEPTLPRRHRGRNCGRSSVLGVEADRFDHEEEFVGAVDLARYAVGHSGPGELGFGEVIEPANTQRVAVLEQEHHVRRIFLPREQEQMIGAKLKHGVKPGAEIEKTSAPLAAPLRGYPGTPPFAGYHHSAALARCRMNATLPANWSSYWPCADCRRRARRSRSSRPGGQQSQ